MPREILYPHIPKTQEPLFPYISPLARRVSVLGWRPPPPERLAEIREKIGRRISQRGRGHDVEYDERAYIIERRLQGLTIKEIAEELGRSEFPIYSVLREAGIGLAEVKKRMIASAEIQESLDSREAIVRLRKAGLSLHDIAKRIGTSVSPVVWHLNRAGQKIDLADFAREVKRKFYATSAALRGPITLSLLERAAEDLRDLILYIDSVAQLLKPAEMELIWGSLDFRHLSEQARMVLLTGIWCLRAVREGVRTVEIRITAGTIEQVKRPITPAAREQLLKCGPAAAQAARFIMEKVPGYDKVADAMYNKAAELEGMLEAGK